MLEQALGGTFVISTQVLGEFASVLLHKMVPPVEPTALSRILTSLGPIRTIPTDADMVLRAVDARGLYGLHFYDCLVLAAAERAGCETIWSEDLNSGQQYFGITVRNPF
jgi:predicted nucleic acid-binding protein